MRPQSIKQGNDNGGHRGHSRKNNISLEHFCHDDSKGKDVAGLGRLRGESDLRRSIKWSPLVAAAHMSPLRVQGCTQAKAVERHFRLSVP